MITFLWLDTKMVSGRGTKNKKYAKFDLCLENIIITKVFQNMKRGIEKI